MPKTLGKDTILTLVRAASMLKPHENEGDKGGDKDKGDKGEKSKKTEFKTLEEAHAYIEKIENEKRELLHETMDRKDKLRKLEKEKEDAENARLKEEGKIKELLDKVQPKADRLDKLEPILNNLFDLEIADIPEEKRDVIPQFQHVEEKLQWVKNAKAKGVFGAPKKETPAGSHNSKPNQEGSLPEFVSWAANDPRLQKLTLAEYQVWKQHNRQTGNKVVGWGG